MHLSINSSGKYTFICEDIYCVGLLVTLRQVDNPKKEKRNDSSRNPEAILYHLPPCQMSAASVFTVSDSRAN